MQWEQKVRECFLLGVLIFPKLKHLLFETRVLLTDREKGYIGKPVCVTDAHFVFVSCTTPVEAKWCEPKLVGVFRPIVPKHIEFTNKD